MDELTIFGICLPRKFPQEEIFVSRHLLVKVRIYDCPFLKKQRLYKLKFNPDAIRFILLPLLHARMACFNILSGGVLTNLCLVCSRES